MKHAGSIAFRNSSLIEGASHRRVKRRSLFKRVIEALHLSRRRQARRLVRHYRHLLAEESRDPPASAFPAFNNEESRQNANGD